MASDTTNPKLRVKVRLEQGRHLTDWVRLNGALPKPSGQRKISLEELGRHCTKDDCWTSYNGRVYDITQYLEYHPGGEAKLMLGAGKDCTALFMKYHKWVNAHAMLSNCFMGLLEEESEPPAENNNNNEQAKRDGSLQPLNREQVLTQAIAQLELTDDGDEKTSETKPAIATAANNTKNINKVESKEES